ncbi:MAG: peptidylprolyl isomerase [Polyangiaceae bacterium]
MGHRLVGLVISAGIVGSFMSSAGCTKGRTSPSEVTNGTSKGDTSRGSGDGAGDGGATTTAIARAEDLRAAALVPKEALVSRDVVLRRGAVRALARIRGASSIEPLVAALADEDAEVVTWAAYGIGATCAGHEDGHVRALVARAASLPAADSRAKTERGVVAPIVAVARALGRCGTRTAEVTLVAWARERDDLRREALLALADLAGRKHALADETTGALVEMLEARATRDVPSGHLAAAPFARLDVVPEAFAGRFSKAATAALDVAGEDRILVLKALGRASTDVVAVLGAFVATSSNPVPERAEAARSLARIGAAGKEMLLAKLALRVPGADPMMLLALGGAEYSVTLGMLEGARGAREDVTKSHEKTLYAFANLRAPGTPPPSLARRLARLRCTAAGILARGAYESEVLSGCDTRNSFDWERARLAALVERPLLGDRGKAFREIAASANPRIRESAAEAIGSHAELGDAAKVLLATMLAAKEAGVVASAADVLAAHPERVTTIAKKEIAAALDPSMPAPVSAPEQEPSPVVAAAMAKAMARTWPEDRVETRVALLDAAVALHVAGARAFVDAACKDPNVTVRARAEKALGLLVTDTKEVACPAPPVAAVAAKELDAPVSRDTRVVLDTDAGRLVLVFEPALAPVAVTRFVAQVRAGFHVGTNVHRVVPGFVAQFGDPEGDGYGGAGMLLRCETSPVPFGVHDIGVALAGRDTGSSQIFVTLAGTPHLDGEYARVGRAEGDWDAVAEGDVIRAETIE